MRNQNKNTRGIIFISGLILSIFLVLLASSMQTKAFDFEQVGSLSLANVNNTIVGGTDVGSTAALWLDMGINDGNATIRILSNATGLNTWTAVTLTGVSANTTCYSNSTCFKSGNTNAGDSLRVTMTFPADAVHAVFRTEVNGSANRTHVLTIDSTAPTFTLYPASGFIEGRVNKTINVTVVTNENVSSIWVYLNNIGKNFSNTLDVAGTNALSRTGDTTWKFSQQLSSDQLVSFYAKAYDYAGDGANGATSSVRTFELNTGPSIGAKYAGQQAAQTTAQSKTIIIVGLIGLAIYLMNRRGR